MAEEEIIMEKVKDKNIGINKIKIQYFLLKIEINNKEIGIKNKI